MISAINSSDKKVNFQGTTIIKKPFVPLTKKMNEAVARSTLGYYNGNVDGHTVIIVSTEAYSKEEAEFLNTLKDKRLQFPSTY